MSSTDSEQSSAADSGLLIVIHVFDSATLESMQKDCLEALLTSKSPEIGQRRQVWFVVRDASQPHGSLSVRSCKLAAAPGMTFRELVVGSGWGWGGIQKLFFRKTLLEQHDALLVIAVEKFLPGAIEQLLRTGDAMSTSELPQVVSLTGSYVESGSPRSPMLVARRYQSTFLARIPFDFNDDEDGFEDDVMRQREHLGVVHEFRAIMMTGKCPGFPSTAPLRRRVENLRFRLHGLGIWCSLKYRDLSPERYRDKSEKAYSSHSLAIEEIRRADVKRVLDLGCGPGHVAKKCRESGIFVHGVDVEPPLPQTVSEFTRCNLDGGTYPFDIWSYDAVLLLDVIEHLSAPEDFLAELRHSGRTDVTGQLARRNRRPIFILTTPNVAFAAIRLGLLLGRFNYADRGILDMTHRRLFTRRSLITALENSGYEIEVVRPVPAPFSAILPGAFGAILNRIAACAAWLFPAWFAFQWLVRCRPKPGLGHMDV